MFQPMIGADNGTIDSVRKNPSERIGWLSRRASSVPGSTDHKDDRECQWQANGEGPANR
jgi:hypothetical protein